MKRRIFRSMSLLSAITVLLTALLIALVYYANSLDDIKKEVQLEAEYIQAGFAVGGDEFLEQIDRGVLEESQARVTIIDNEGNVLYDSATNASLENHFNRPEVQQAMKIGTGEDRRTSETLATHSYYYAVALGDGSVLRVAGTISSVFTVFMSIIPTMILIVLIVFVISLLVAGRQTKRIVKPLNQMDLEAPMKNVVYEELSPLLSRIEMQNQLIHQQLSDIRAKQADFKVITGNMREGMIIVDTAGQIISYNNSATQILNLNNVEGKGQSFLVFNRSIEFQEAVASALAGKATDQILEIGERKFQMLVNPVKDGSDIRGALILMLDVTERLERDQLRREFSANVSHELKTPMNVVSGYAELMKNGLVQPQDVQKFAGNIYKEAQRMISLIEDIIKVSRLDENTGDLPREDTDLYDLTALAIECLQSSADKRQITLNLIGEHIRVLGVRQILSEMVFNLCENAIKYNRDGGQVDITIRNERGKPTITVHDTGIGIPESQMNRVFERFYRVDKSHSRAIGGTGLGLSIVKHGAAYHNAEISLKSREGIGTTVKILFPKQMKIEEK